MEIINRITNGVHSDNDPNQQPEGTMRKSINGVIMDVGEGNYVWEAMKGTSVSFTLPSGYDIHGWCMMLQVQDRLNCFGPDPILN